MDALTYATLKRGWVRPRLFAAAALAVAIMLPATKPVQAATLTVSYDAVAQVSSDPLFFTGVTTVPLTGANPTLVLQAGQYFRFGVDAVVTNNPNPVAGDPYDVANQKFQVNNNGAPEPANLGLNSIGFQVSTTGGLTTVLNPTSTNNGSRTLSSAAVDPTATIHFSSKDPGDVNNGVVGGSFQLGGGFSSLNDGDTTLTTDLTTTEIFSKLAFQAVAPGATTLTTTVDVTGNTKALSFVSATTLGSVMPSGAPGAAPTYNGRAFDGTMDNVVTGGIGDNLPVISVVVTPVPEPMSLGLFGAITGLLLLRRRKAL